MKNVTTLDLVYNAVLRCAAVRKDCSAGGIFDAYVKNGGKPTAFGEVFLALQRMEREEQLRIELVMVDGKAVQWWFAIKAAAIMPSYETKEAA